MARVLAFVLAGRRGPDPGPEKRDQEKFPATRDGDAHK
jgi:hypothetical protein